MRNVNEDNLYRAWNMTRQCIEPISMTSVLTMPSRDTMILMEYTGYLDSHNRMIYESDLITYPSFGDKRWEVMYTRNGQWIVRNNDELYLMNKMTEQPTVIGTIYDDPAVL